MLGVVVPAHDEEAVISDCLAALKIAARHPRLRSERVEILVVLDTCTDQTAALVEGADIASLTVGARNVGMARALGAQALIAQGVRWLSFTDADSRVAPDWLAEQLALQADVVCGTVSVDDWSPHGEHAELLEWHFQQTYFDAEGHRHIHGANLGVSVPAYQKAGGFQHLACSEDVALVAALEASGARIAWSARPRVTTSARRNARAAGGFAEALTQAVAMRLEQAARKYPSNVDTSRAADAAHK